MEFRIYEIVEKDERKYERKLRSVHGKKVIKVPFTFMNDIPVKSDQRSVHERELNRKSSVPTILCMQSGLKSEKKNLHCLHQRIKSMFVQLFSNRKLKNVHFSL